MTFQFTCSGIKENTMRAAQNMYVTIVNLEVEIRM